MTEIIPGIHQLQIPVPDNTLGYTNTYLVQGDGQYLLIDTGWDSKEALQSLEKQLADIQVDLGEIRQIVITHVHPDHYGLASKLKQLSQAKLALHHLEKNFAKLIYTNTDKFFHQVIRQLHTHGMSTDELTKSRPSSARMRRHIAPVPPDITLRGGENIPIGTFNLQVLWTPGHSPGHICLYEPTQKILFSGDHILPTITPNISLHPQSGTNPLGDFLNSINMVKQLDVNLVLPAHEHMFTGLQTRIEEINQHHKQRNLEILEAIKARPKTAYQISTEITWMPDMDSVSWQNMAPLDKRFAVLETIAHLESMRFSRKVDRFSKDNTIYYHILPL